MDQSDKIEQADVLSGNIWRLGKMIGAGVLGLLFVALLVVMLRTPSHDRNWRSEIAVMPQVAIDGSVFSIDQIRDWRYEADHIAQQTYHSGDYDADELVGTWLMVEPFGGTDAIAHTLVLFEFTDNRLLALTIEARKEEGEIYSALRGAFNTYELVYLWAEARDVLTRRARYLKHEVFVYPIALTQEDRPAFFGALINKTNRLYQRPRFYNTLFSNCTNELAKTAGLPWNSAFMLTGNAPQHLFKVGTIPGRGNGWTFDRLKEAAKVTDLIQTVDDEEASLFDRGLLTAMKARFKALQADTNR